MAIPLIGAAISGIIQGAKSALTKAIASSLTEHGIDFVGKIKSLTNIDTIMLTRLKVVPDAALRRVVAKTLGLTDSQLISALRKYNPTAKATQLSKGLNFTKNLQTEISKAMKNKTIDKSQTLLENIGYFENNNKGRITIKSIKEKLKRGILKNNDPKKYEIDLSNSNVKKMLSNIEEALIKRVYGLYDTATNKSQIKYTKRIDIVGLFEPTIEYQNITLSILQSIYDKVTDSAFDLGSDMQDVWVIEEDRGDYGVYSASFIKNFIDNIISEVAEALLMSTDKRFSNIDVRK